MKMPLFLALLLTVCTTAAAEEELDLSQYSDKIVMLDFWASWCIPCRQSFPWMNEMQEKYRDAGLVIVAVNVDQDQENAESFLEEFPAEFAILFDPDASIAKEFGVEVMPTSFLIDRDGNLAARHSGFRESKKSRYEAEIRKVLELPD